MILDRFYFISNYNIFLVNSRMFTRCFTHSYQPSTIVSFSTTAQERSTSNHFKNMRKGQIIQVWMFRNSMPSKLIILFSSKVIYNISDYFCLVYLVMFHDTDKSLQSSIPILDMESHRNQAHPRSWHARSGTFNVFGAFTSILHAIVPIELRNKVTPQHELFWRDDWYTRRYWLLIGGVGELDVKRERYRNVGELDMKRECIWCSEIIVI